MCRDCFARYLKLTRRALSDASAIAAAAAAGITAGGQPLQPLHELVEAAGRGAGGEGGAVADSVASGATLPTLAILMAAAGFLGAPVAHPACSAVGTFSTATAAAEESLPLRTLSAFGALP
jgi:hypothetical protein